VAYPSTNGDIFDSIYRYHWWIFGSGTGSISAFNRPFIDYVNDFLRSHTEVHTVVDIGCGDWQIAQHFDLRNREYIGCDVSAVILEKTRTRFAAPRRRFVHLDAVTDELPDGDLVIVKDVLHHLSNANVSSILSKLARYKYTIVQNDIYAVPHKNSDINNGGFRPLDITTLPFNAPFYRTATYTESLRKPLNMARLLVGLPAINKGIFVPSTQSAR